MHWLAVSLEVYLCPCFFIESLQAFLLVVLSLVVWKETTQPQWIEHSSQVVDSIRIVPYCSYEFNLFHQEMETSALPVLGAALLSWSLTLLTHVFRKVGSIFESHWQRLGWSALVLQWLLLVPFQQPCLVLFSTVRYWSNDWVLELFHRSCFMRWIYDSLLHVAHLWWDRYLFWEGFAWHPIKPWMICPASFKSTRPMDFAISIWSWSRNQSLSWDYAALRWVQDCLSRSYWPEVSSR